MVSIHLDTSPHQQKLTPQTLHWLCFFFVAAIACLLTASVIIYKSKEIFLTPFNLTGHKLSDIFFIIIHTSYVRLWVSEWLLKVKWATFKLYYGKNKSLVNEIMMISAFQYCNISWICIVLAHWNNSPRETCCPNQGHYPDSEPTGLCTFLLMLRF